MRNIQNWKIKQKSKKHKEVEMENFRDVYKKEILDTRITVSDIVSDSRMINLLDLKRI